MRKPRLICNIAVLFFLFLGLPILHAHDDEIERARELNQRMEELYQEGKFAEAIPIAKASLSIREKSLGANHPDVAESLNDFTRSDGLLQKRAVRQADELGASQKTIHWSTRMILNIHQLRSFYHAARHHSVSKAAQALMVTPPAITMQIKQLEDHLGLRLMYLDGHAIELTEIGRTVFQKAERVFQGIQEMENFLEDVSTSRAGELRIGCPQTPAKFIMPRLISRFQEAYPGIHIVLDQGTSSELARKILNQEVDLAFVRYRPE